MIYIDNIVYSGVNLYDKKKDRCPIETISKIKGILSSIDLNLREEWLQHKRSSKNAPFSIRINIPGCKKLGTNGKGTTQEYALASAYAEFMERIQNELVLSFLNDDFEVAPDEKQVSVNYILNNKNSFIDLLIETYANSEVSGEKIISRLNDLSIKRFPFLYESNKKEETIAVVPFYDVRNNKVTYLPSSLIMLSQTSNGMSAGNTPEEALVQGLSEVVERFALIKIIYDHLVLPEVPKSLYLDYSELKKIINYIESFGIKVTIKDASLGLNMPVICAVFEHKKRKSYMITLGAHPSLPIAIERSLTEFLQGFDVSDPSNLDEFHSYDEYNELKKDDFYIMRDAAVCARLTILKPEFFEDSPSYAFDYLMWKNYEKVDNKKMMNMLIELCLEIGQDLFIRDVSFMGFPSFQIVSPKMTILSQYNEEHLNESINFFECKGSLSIKSGKFPEYGKFMDALLYNLNLKSNTSLIPTIEDEFALYFLGIYSNDYKLAETFINRLNLNKAKTKEEKMFIIACKEYLYSLKKGFPEEKALHYLKNNKKLKLSKFYLEIFEFLDPKESLLKLLAINISTIKNSKRSVVQEEQFDHSFVEEVQKKLQKIYKSNIIDQSIIGSYIA